MRLSLFIGALIGLLVSALCVLAATRFLGLIPFYWGGVAALAATLAFNCYIAVEGRNLFGDPDDDDAP